MHRCKECGTTVDPSCYPPMYESPLQGQQLCFSCLHWAHYLSPPIGTPSSRRVIVGREAYSMVPDRPKGATFGLGVGYGGMLHHIRWLTGDDQGKIVDSRNLWHVGTVPDHFADRLVPNAEFLRYPTDPKWPCDAILYDPATV